ncbi:MAG: alkaline phosphatase [Flavobacteriaceae bacterium]
MIGDGRGIAQISISTTFYFGGRSPKFQRFNSLGFYNSRSTGHWITDSAAGATTFAKGRKTQNRVIGVLQDTLPKETILENLKQREYQTAIKTRTTLTRATSASFYAHVKDRDMYEEIAVQPVVADIDFLAGGGKNYFNRRSHHRDHFKPLKNGAYLLDALVLSRPIA